MLISRNTFSSAPPLRYLPCHLLTPIRLFTSPKCLSPSLSPFLSSHPCAPLYTHPSPSISLPVLNSLSSTRVPHSLAPPSAPLYPLSHLFPQTPSLPSQKQSAANGQVTRLSLISWANLNPSLIITSLSNLSNGASSPMALKQTTPLFYATRPSSSSFFASFPPSRSSLTMLILRKSSHDSICPKWEIVRLQMEVSQWGRVRCL